MNEQAINDATEALLRSGIRVFNAFLLRDTEAEHAQRLLALMDPPPDAKVLDAGCGIGELARLMADDRPDLEFILLNTNEEQLLQCPPEMVKLRASYDEIPMPDESVDVVMYAFSLCHSQDWLVTLREAVRVLRPGGTVFIYDMARTPSTPHNTLMRDTLSAEAYLPSAAIEQAIRAGLQLHEALGHEPKVERLRQVFDKPVYYGVAFDGVIPVTYRLTKMRAMPAIESAFSRHQRIGFQFSGGRDSWAAAWELRDYWDRMDFYHLDTGDQFPEARESVEAFEKVLGRPLKRIETDVASLRADYGMPSDVVPVDNTPIGRMVSGRTIKIVSRYECCARALMNPLHQRMLDDRITLIVRGQRDDEYDAPPKRSGDTENGMEVLYPIESWTAAAVDAYVKEHALPVPPFYERGMKRAPECMGCTAWWDEGRAAYLQQRYPEQYATYRERLATVTNEVRRQLAMLEAD